MNGSSGRLPGFARCFYVTVVAVLSFAAAVYVLVLNLFTTSRVLCDELEFNFYCGDIFIANIVLLLSGLFLCVALPKTKIYSKIRDLLNNKKPLMISKALILSLIGIFGIVLIASSDYKQVYDSKSILDAVEGLHTKDYSSFLHLGYLDIYPHLNGLVLFYYLLSFIAQDRLETLILLINLAFLILLYEELSAIAKRLGAGVIGQLLILIAGLLYLPPFMDVLIVYGSIESLAFCALTARLLMDLMSTTDKKKCVVKGILAVICSGLACMFKQNSFVMLFALIIWLFFICIAKKKYLKMLPMIGILVMMAASSSVPGIIFSRITGYRTSGTNYISYLAMGASEDTQNFAGGYNGFNAFSFADLDGDKKAQGDLALEIYKERVNTFIDDPAYMLNFMTRKQVHQWSDPIYRANRSIQVMEEGPSNSPLMRGLTGRMSTYIQSYIYEPFQLLVWAGVALYLWINCKRRDDSLINGLIFPLMFLGGFIFHTFWEAKSPYAYPYFVILIPIAVIGLRDLGSSISKFHSTHKKIDLKALNFSWSLRFTMAAVTVILLMAAVLGLSTMRVQLSDDEAQYRKYAQTGVFVQADNSDHSDIS